MPIEGLSPFDFTSGIITVTQFAPSAALPKEDPSRPSVGEISVGSKLEELFKSHQLDEVETSSMNLPPETLKILSRESLKSLITDMAPLLEAAGGIAPIHDIARVQEMLQEEFMNHELLAAFRRTILGG
ncbi:MAG: hypothetical protein K2W97_02120 [Chthoniobacterales bacterium]|nr:hypothetical protein [Chthoniobacterales bacterium]